MSTSTRLSLRAPKGVVSALSHAPPPWKPGAGRIDGSHAHIASKGPGANGARHNYPQRGAGNASRESNFHRQHPSQVWPFQPRNISFSTTMNCCCVVLCCVVRTNNFCDCSHTLTIIQGVDCTTVRGSRPPPPKVLTSQLRSRWILAHIRSLPQARHDAERPHVKTSGIPVSIRRSRRWKSQ
jgi:hypothetical protein